MGEVGVVMGIVGVIEELGAGETVVAVSSAALSSAGSSGPLVL